MLTRLKLGLPIFLAALNMRAGLVLIAPLIPIIKSYFDLTNLEISFLAAIPLACYSGTSLFMGLISRLGTSSRIITWALTALSIGLIARAFTGVIGLFLFTFLMGVSIAVLNYEIPVWVKVNAVNDAGFMTGTYVTIMGVTAALATAISVPLAELSNLSWRLSMIPWMVLAVMTAIYWRGQSGRRAEQKQPPTPIFWRSGVARSPMAWALVFFFGFESMTFYATATWLPTILTTKDFALNEAALALAVAGLVGSLIGLLAPHYIERILDKRLILALVSALTAFSLVMISLQSGAIIFLWLCLANIGVSIAFPVALLLCSTKTDSPEATRNLSTMMQSVGYLISSTGPIFMAKLFESSGSWNYALHGAVVLCLLQLVMGLIVGKPNKITQ